MPKAENDDRRICNLVTQFMVANDDTSDLAWFVGVKLLANAWKVGQVFRRARELLDHSRRRPGRDRPQMLVQAHEIR